MENIRIEEVGDINSEYPYLEVFLRGSVVPFLEISISTERKLSFKFYVSKSEVLLEIAEWEYILLTAKEFLPRALKNEDDYLKSLKE